MAEQTVFHVYIDESCHTGHDFMVVGAIFCSNDAATEIAEDMCLCLQRHGQKDDTEFHWTDLQAHTLALYKDVLTRLVTDTLIPGKTQYRALVVDMTHVDRSINKDRNREATLAQFIFTLVFGFARSFATDRYHLWIDKRADSVHDLEMDARTLGALNHQAISEFGWDEGPFVALEFLDSRTSRLIQAVDMITGAIAYDANQKHLLPNASKHRIALWRHVLDCTTLQTLVQPSPRRPLGIQIARVELSNGRAEE